MSSSVLLVKKKDLQKISSVIQDFQAKIVLDVDAAKLRDALNLTLLQMQTYWKVLKKKQDHGKADKYIWPWYDLKKPASNKPQYLANSMHGAGVHKDKMSELFDMLSSGDGESCQKYIESVGYHGEVDSLGRTPLHYCAGVPELEHYIKFFASNGCNVNHQAHDGSTALHRAVMNENPIVTDDLLQLNANTSLCDIDGRSPAHWAVEVEDTVCLQLLLKYDAEINKADKEGETPVMWAAKRGKVDALKIILASPNGPKLASIMDDKGQSLLHMGVSHMDVVDLFLNSDTVHQKDKLERNILHHAAFVGKLDVCKAIADKFDLVKLMVPDSDGRTPVHHAVNNAHSGVTNFLLERGGSTVALDKQGLTPHGIAQIKQLHYCSIVISAYHQDTEMEQSSNSIQTRPHSPKPLQSPVAPILPIHQNQAPMKPIASLTQHPNDRRVIILNNSGNKTNSGVSKSSPRLKFSSPANVSTITPGLLRHSSHQIQQVGQQKPQKLRELGEIRDMITGRSTDQSSSLAARPSSSRGKRNKRPSSPLPADAMREAPQVPWKLNIIPPKPPPPKDGTMTNGHSPDDKDSMPERPRTARGNNIEINRDLQKEDSGIMQLSSTHISATDDQKQSTDIKMSPRYSKIDQIPPRKGDSVVIEQTLELHHSLPEALPLRGSSLLGPMPMIPGRQVPSEPNPWYKKKLNPVSPNRMDILQPETPGNDMENEK